MELNIIIAVMIIALYSLYAINRLIHCKLKDKHPIVLSVGLTPLLMGTVIFAVFLVIEAMYGAIDTMPMVNSAFELFTYTFALIVLSTLATITYFSGLLLQFSFPFIKKGYKYEIEALKNTNFTATREEDYADYLAAKEQWQLEDEQWWDDQQFAYMYESNNY